MHQMIIKNKNTELQTTEDYHVLNKTKKKTKFKKNNHLQSLLISIIRLTLCDCLPF